jgi:hypothetical protein
MRGFLGFAVFVLVLLTLGAALLAPAVLAPMVVSAIRDASPFGDQPLDVEVRVDALGLIRGFVGEIRVSGTNLGRDGLTIGSLAVTAREVGIGGDHAFASLFGTLGRVAVPQEDGDPIVITRIELSGPSSDLTATAHLDRAAAIAFIQRAFDQQGVAVSDIELAGGSLSFVVFEQRAAVPVGVQDGALVIPDMLGGGPVELLAPLPEDAWRLSGASITADGMDLTASIDAARLLRPGARFR